MAGQKTREEGVNRDFEHPRGKVLIPANEMDGAPLIGMGVVREGEVGVIVEIWTALPDEEVAKEHAQGGEQEPPEGGANQGNEP